MTIILTGGGTGGHITPLLAVAHELKAKDPSVWLVYIGEKHAKFEHLTKDAKDFDAVYKIYAGKFRRYNGESWPRRLVDFKTNLMNLRDAFRVFIGLWQSLFLLLKLKPQAIFIKGGFVGMPVGLTAALLHIPFVTHDSDTMPGLANRLVSRWAAIHAVGMPKEFYKYPPEKTEYTGIPITFGYRPVSRELQGQYKRQIGVEGDQPVLLVTGGSLGAERLNVGFRKIVEPLLSEYPNLVVVHQVGKGGLGIYEDLPADLRKRIIADEFYPDLNIYSGAADVIITRAGATAIAEFAMQKKACILIPNPLLAGGHQLKNAEHLAELGAVKIIAEDQLAGEGKGLLDAVSNLLKSPEEREKLGDAFGKLAKPEATKDLAEIILITANKK